MPNNTSADECIELIKVHFARCIMHLIVEHYQFGLDITQSSKNKLA